MLDHMKKIINLFKASNIFGIFSMLLYMFEILIYRLIKFRIRKTFTIMLYNLDFLVKTHNMDLAIVYEIFGRRVYEAVPDFIVKDGYTCIDVGANIGCVSLLWGQNNKNGVILALEPHPETFMRLKKNLELNEIHNAIPLQYAITKDTGSVELEVADNTGMAFSKGCRPGKVGTAITMSVPAYSLDNLFAKYHLENVNILKIDVEGHEVECFKGAFETLKNTEKVILEYHSADLRNQCVDILEDAGFTLNLLDWPNRLLFASKN